MAKMSEKRTCVFLNFHVYIDSYIRIGYIVAMERKGNS